MIRSALLTLTAAIILAAFCLPGTCFALDLKPWGGSDQSLEMPGSGKAEATGIEPLAYYIFRSKLRRPFGGIRVRSFGVTKVVNSNGTLHPVDYIEAQNYLCYNNGSWVCSNWFARYGYNRAAIKAGWYMDTWSYLYWFTRSYHRYIHHGIEYTGYTQRYRWL